MSSPHPSPALDTPRLRLIASSASLAPEVLEFQMRNCDNFAPWDPPLSADFLTMAAQRRRLRHDVKSFADGSGWRWWLQQRNAPPRVIGQIHFSQISRGPFCSAVVGYQIDREFEGRGLMREALTTAIDELFSPHVNLHRVQANVRPENVRSLGLLERLGFVREGLARDYLYIDGAWRDHVTTARLNPAFVKPREW